MAKTEFKKHGQDISRIVPAAVKDESKIPKIILSQEEEHKALNEVTDQIAKEFGAEIEIIKAQDSKEAKAKNAQPSKPAILVQ